MVLHRLVVALWCLLSWNNPATNRLLFEGGASYYVMGIAYEEQAGVSRDAIAVRDLTTGYTLNSRAITVRAGDAYGNILDQVWATKAAVSYVTGTHNFKTGIIWTFNRAEEDSRIHGDVLNALNANSMLANNATYGARWLEPVEILSGRPLKFGAQFTF